MPMPTAVRILRMSEKLLVWEPATARYLSIPFASYHKRSCMIFHGISPLEKERMEWFIALCGISPLAALQPRELASER